MRVLLVLPEPPVPDGGAAGRCAIALIRGLHAHGFEVKAVAAGTNGAEAVPPDLDIELIPWTRWNSLSSRIHRYTDPVSEMARSPVADRVRALAGTFDIVHLVEINSAAIGRELPAPTVTQLHCLARRDRPLREYLQRRRSSPSSTPWTQEIRVAVELKRAERGVRRRSQWLIANSPEVARELRGHGAHAVTVMPLALDPVYYEPVATTAPSVAGMIGSAAWPPTSNAVRRLVRDVWPRVLLRRPGAVMRLAGRGMERSSFAGLPDLPGIEWIGEVASAQDFLRSLGLMLYPLGRGSGTKVKVLEAIALGLPVVTTPDGAEGLADNAGVTVEASDDRLAARVIHLLDDAAARRTIGAAARAHFEREHTPLAATAVLRPLYEAMADAHASPR